jgi:hypothetical protein
MPYHWPEDNLDMPKRRRRWPFRLFVILLVIIVFVVVWRWPGLR